LDILGFPITSDLERPPMLNPSPSPQGAEVLRLWNFHVRENRRDVTSAIARHFSASPHEQSLLSPQARQVILDASKEGNRWVAAKFFGRPRGPLFLEPLVHGSWSAPGEPKIQDVVALAARLWMDESAHPAALSRQLEEMRRQLDALHGSRSWRITAPLRAIHRRVCARKAADPDTA
jgi:hypothetical protein